MVAIGNSWDRLLESTFQSETYGKVRAFLKEEYKNHTVYPPAGDIFNALKHTPYEDVRVVILGQDPYHEPGQAHGLSFSVQPGVPAPPSLKNNFKEQRTDLGISQPALSLLNLAQSGMLASASFLGCFSSCLFLPLLSNTIWCCSIGLCSCK